MDITETLLQRLKKLSPGDRQHFLHGVYKQLVPSHSGKTSNGEFCQKFNDLEDISKGDFIIRFASALKYNGMGNHEQRLVSTYDMDGAYNTWRNVEETMRSVDPSLERRSQIYVNDDGTLIIDVGDFTQDPKFGAMVFTVEGFDEDEYFVRARFYDRSHEEFGMPNALGPYNLREALAIANLTQQYTTIDLIFTAMGEYNDRFVKKFMDRAMPQNEATTEELER